MTMTLCMQRVLVLISSGSSDRAELRTRKARAEAQAENGTLDPLRVATEARIYYNKIMRRVEKRPKKILEHTVPFPGCVPGYLCFWSDVGYADQDVEAWKPADYAMQFPGLVEDYRKVCEPRLGCEHCLSPIGVTWLPEHAHVAIWETTCV